MRTANPALKAFERSQTWDDFEGKVAKVRPMTIQGTVLATSILLAICAGVGIWSWNAFADGTLHQGWGWGGLLGGLVLALVIVFVPRTAPFLSPVYAAAEGLFLGIISYLVPRMYEGAGDEVVIQALGLTFGILAILLIAYASGLVRIGGTAARVIAIATGGIALYYVAGMLFSAFGAGWFPRLGWDASPIGIGFSVVVVILASLNLVLDFQFIEAGVKQRAPKYMEWYGAFGLLVTLVWLYFELLRLLAKIAGRE